MIPCCALAQTVPADLPDVEDFWRLVRPAQAYDCAQATCEQIRSCEEACYKLLVCGHTRRDGDGDGIPCEELCSRRC